LGDMMNIILDELVMSIGDTPVGQSANPIVVDEKTWNAIVVDKELPPDGEPKPFPWLLAGVGAAVIGGIVLVRKRR